MPAETTGNVSGELDPRGKQAEGYVADQIQSTRNQLQITYLLSPQFIM